MGFTPSAASAADLLGMPSLACTVTLRSSKRALWIFLLCAAFCAFTANAMDGNNADKGDYTYTGVHIYTKTVSLYIRIGRYAPPCAPICSGLRLR